MAEPAFTNKPPSAQLKVLQRCKNCLVALVEELQKQLPINQLMKNLKMLNPRVAISGDKNIGPNSNKITKHHPYKSSSIFGCPVETVPTN